MSPLPDVETDYAGELFRKGIHICSLSIPIIYYYITKSTALSILVPLTFLFLITDVARVFHPPSRKLYNQLFGWLLRSHERNHVKKRLNGATFVLLSAVICILLFPKLIVLTAFSILIISDTLAALVGRKLGKNRFLKKSVEGSTAFFLSAMVVVMVAPKAGGIPVEYLIGGIGALVGTVVEASGAGIDDNLSIPISVGVVMWGLYALLLPSVNLYFLDGLA